MILDDVVASVEAQMNDQAALGVHVADKEEVPETGPANGGVWWRIQNVTAVFADLKSSTSLSVSGSRQDSAIAYTYFVRAMTVILDQFRAGYIDIHGDGIFGLFSGRGSEFLAAACAITMRTQIQRAVAPRFRRESSTDWKLTAGIGMDRGTLLVRRLGLRGTKQNEVWAGRPVNVAAKLSSVALPNQVVVSDRVFSRFAGASTARRRALIWSCGCDGEITGDGLALPEGQTAYLWDNELAPQGMGLDFETVHRLDSKWCAIHGAAFCETIVSGRTEME